MGNSQSQANNKESQLWSQWTCKEQEQLKQQYESPASLPNYFSTELSSCFESILRSKDLPHYLELAHQLVKTKDTQPAYLVFQQSVNDKQVSLKTFVSWVVKSSIPIWFQGSSYSWTDDSDGDEQLLIDYLLYHAKEKERQQKESVSWLNDQATSTLDDEKESWETKVTTAPSQITQFEFLAWIDSSPGFLSLFQTASNLIVFAQPIDNEQLHQKRLQHMASPCIQKHNKETRKLFGQGRFSSLMTPYDYFMLSLHLPSNALSWSEYEITQRKVQEDLQHTLLFSSRRDGTSWQVFVGKMVGQGATFVVIKAKDGSVFGGYLDEASCSNTGWYGNSANFLFRVQNKYGAWGGSAGSNDHFQYLCWGKKSLPNGFGMGGQFDYAGLWMDADFIHGHSKAGPLCTTYASPQLSIDQTFLIDEVEVWLVRPLQKDENEDDINNGKGVLSHSEDMEFMEMAGKKMYSKDLGPEPTEEDEQEE